MKSDRLADWLAWQETLHPSVIDLGLVRVQRVLGRLGWKKPPYPVITVAGTNGKGSSVALLAAILSAGGYRVGTFTSPHLTRYNERIRIDGAEVSDASLVAAFARIDAAREGDSLTFFEFNTLAALLVFETAGLDVMVLEVGLGGRLDAVNVVDADVALVTSIALDHCEWLGPDVEAIGREKAGIFRAGQPAVFAGRDMPVSVGRVAADLGTRLQRLGADFDFAVTASTWRWWSADLRMEGLPPPALAGEAQYANAAGVIAALAELRGRLRLDPEAIKVGLSGVRLPGRFEVRDAPVSWVFDVAHNPAAAGVLARNLAAWPVKGRTLAVCGILGDKDVEAVATAMLPVVDSWLIAALPGPRAGTVADTAARFANAGARPDAVLPDVDSACELAAASARVGDRVVVFGSFLTVGPARAWFARYSSSDPSPAA